METAHPDTKNNQKNTDLRKTGIDPNFWYPIVRSSELKAGKALDIEFAGTSIVVVRPKVGAVYALENRCAHRQVPLHVGTVSNTGIKCGYHGWEYDANGNCIDIPYLSGCKKQKNKVRSFPAKEAYGLIFIYPGDNSKIEKVFFPEVNNANNNDYKIRYLNRRVDCHYSFMHENLMDMNHQFLHRRLMGGIKTIFLGTREGDNWVETDYTFKRKSGKQPLGEKFMLGKRPAALEKTDRDFMTIRTEYPYQTLKFWTAGSSEPAIDLWNVYVPLGKNQNSNHTFGLMMIKRPSMKLLLEVAWPFIIWFTNGIFAEDKWICQLEQEAFDRQGEDQNQEIFPAIINLRRVLRNNGIPLRED